MAATGAILTGLTVIIVKSLSVFPDVSFTDTVSVYSVSTDTAGAVKLASEELVSSCVNVNEGDAVQL